MIIGLVKILVIALIGYIIGSIPTGYLIVKAFKGEDIRKIGSGSTGATNVKRVMGRQWFYITLALDLIKGMIPV
ncbi:glycerol-3-phosphate acyltransferase, partial [bacterium]|nr:glycerol-3-phosphate acyltransferase [bacterium]